jgi:hypothetical protein
MRKAKLNLMFLMLMIPLLFSGADAFAGELINLKISEGFRFSDGVVTDCDDIKADVAFHIENLFGSDLIVLSGKKIKKYGKLKPNQKWINDKRIKDWHHHIDTPSRGYYVIQGNDGKSFYLINVHSIKRDWRAVSDWQLTFSWDRL